MIDRSVKYAAICFGMCFGATISNMVWSLGFWPWIISDLAGAVVAMLGFAKWIDRHDRIVIATVEGTLARPVVHIFPPLVMNAATRDYVDKQHGNTP